MAPTNNDTRTSDHLFYAAFENLTDFHSGFAFNYSTLDGNQTYMLLGNSTTTQTPLTTPDPMEAYANDNSIIAKITLLLVVTAVVLIVSYKFVVRLFLGYADRKDDMVPEGYSDDEDSAVVKRAVEHAIDFG